jgi:hypothetical protein
MRPSQTNGRIEQNQKDKNGIDLGVVILPGVP